MMSRRLLLNVFVLDLVPIVLQANENAYENRLYSLKYDKMQCAYGVIQTTFKKAVLYATTE